MLGFTYFMSVYTAFSLYKASSYFWMKTYDDTFKAFSESPLRKYYEQDDE